MNLSEVMKLFAGLPPDSQLAKLGKEFLTMLLTDARNGGAVGNSFARLVDAARNPNEAAFATLEPTVRMQTLGVMNALKGAIDG